MNADVFVDTNILLYTIDEDAASASKRQRSQQLLLTERWGWSVQVAAEFLGKKLSLFQLKYLGNQPPFPAPRQPGSAAGVVVGVLGHGILSGEGAQCLEPMAVASFVQFAQDKRHGGAPMRTIFCSAAWLRMIEVEEWWSVSRCHWFASARNSFSCAAYRWAAPLVPDCSPRPLMVRSLMT